MSAAESLPLDDARSAQSPTRRRRRDRPEMQRAAASRLYAVGRRHSNGFSMHLLFLISTSYPSVKVSGGRPERWAKQKGPRVAEAESVASVSLVYCARVGLGVG